MRIFFTILITFFIFNKGISDTIEYSLIKNLEQLNTKNVGQILIIKYEINNKFYIAFDDPELKCIEKSVIYYLFWSENGNSYCKRIDACGEFIPITKKFSKVNKLRSGLKKAKVPLMQDPQKVHFELTLFENNLELRRIKLSGKQVKDGKKGLPKGMNKLKKQLDLLEKEKVFKREKKE
jgi:hypothetical protein